MKNDKEDFLMKTVNAVKITKARAPLPLVKECISYICTSGDNGYIYSHFAPFSRCYVFYSKGTLRQYTFSLSELRWAFKHGW